MRLYREYKENKIYTESDIDDYMDKITSTQISELINHCNKYKIYPCICLYLV